ncbi:MAG: mandelate racemase/muconate lactonizing enzyme family protein [Janthinobacterium lividum]
MLHEAGLLHEPGWRMTRDLAITRVSTHHAGIPYAYDGPRHAVGGQGWTTLDMLLVRIETAGGLVGWGEAFGHGAIPATKAALDTLVAPWLLGRDASQISAIADGLSQAMHLFGRNGPLTYAIAGVDIALWDMAGKRAGLPLHDLLGGARRRTLPVYASLLRYGDPARTARNAAAARDEGYSAVKLHEIDPACVLAARAALGPEAVLMDDVNCPWTVAEALEQARLLRPAALHWLEEPVWPPEDVAGLARVRAAGAMTAAGENIGTAAGFAALFEARAADVAQPSVAKISITETLRVVALAAAAGVRVVPHCAYFGPGYLASLHLAATMAEAPLERLWVALEASPFDAWLEAPGGVASLPTGPGLGCDPDPAILDRYRQSPTGETRSQA